MTGRLTPTIGARPSGASIASAAAMIGPSPIIAGDFSERVAYLQSRGTLVRSFGFDVAGDLGTYNYGYVAGAGWGWNWDSVETQLRHPVIDTTSFPGIGALRCDIPTNTGSSAAGSWGCRFADNDSILIGAGQSIFVQMKVRWNSAMPTICAQNAGVKFFDFGTGGQANLNLNSTSSHTKQVWQTRGDGSTTPILYGYVAIPGGPVNAERYEVLPGDYRFQSEMPNCLYSLGGGGRDCFDFPVDEWVTVQLGIDIISIVSATGEFFAYPSAWTAHDESWHLRQRIWITRENGSTTLIHDFGPTSPGYSPMYRGDPVDNEKLGRLTIFPYITSKNPLDTHPTGQVWYDELIIATEKIPDPGITLPSTYPLWRQGKTVGQIYSITGPPSTVNMSGLHLKAPGANDSSMVDAWIGFAADEGKWWSALSTGHATMGVSWDWQNPVLMIDFAADAPAWTTYEAGSDYSAVTPWERYNDGRPCSRHTYYTTVHIPAGVMADGLERVMLFACYGAYATDGTLFPVGYRAGLEVVGFKVDPAQWVNGSGWEPNGTHPNYPSSAGDNIPAVCKDPRTHDVYLCGSDYKLMKWTPATDSWETFVATGQGILNGTIQGSLIDVNRNRHVLLCDGRPYSNPGVIRLQCVDLTTKAITFIYVTGPLASSYEAGIVHDLDNDRYIVVVGAVMYAVNPTTGVSTALATVEACAGTNECVGRLAYLPDQGCVVYLGRYPNAIQFMPTR